MSLSKIPFVLAVVGAVFVVVPVQAATVTMSASDGFGTSSFNSAGQWDNAAAPSAGNDYFTSQYRLRTPTDGNSYTFAGDSLTIDPTGAAPGDLLGMSYKGTGNTGTITVGNLILNGGAINHLNGVGDVFNLDGSISVVADSYIYAKQGLINVMADISGSSSITNPGSDGPERTLTFLSSTSTFTGDIINDGRFALADDAVLNFVIGASGVNNSVSGTGAEAVFDGDFVLDLSGAGTSYGDSWAIVSAANASYGETFNVVGFTPSGDVWANGDYRFNEGTGVLSVVPEPGSLALVLIGVALAAGCRRRRS